MHEHFVAVTYLLRKDDKTQTRCSYLYTMYLFFKYIFDYNYRLVKLTNKISCKFQ